VFPYTTLFRSAWPLRRTGPDGAPWLALRPGPGQRLAEPAAVAGLRARRRARAPAATAAGDGQHPARAAGRAAAAAVAARPGRAAAGAAGDPRGPARQLAGGGGPALSGARVARNRCFRSSRGTWPGRRAPVTMATRRSPVPVLPAWPQPAAPL